MRHCRIHLLPAITAAVLSLLACGSRGPAPRTAPTATEPEDAGPAGEPVTTYFVVQSVPDLGALALVGEVLLAEEAGEPEVIGTVTSSSLSLLRRELGGDPDDLAGLPRTVITDGGCRAKLGAPFALGRLCPRDVYAVDLWMTDARPGETEEQTLWREAQVDHVAELIGDCDGAIVATPEGSTARVIGPGDMPPDVGVALEGTGWDGEVTAILEQDEEPASRDEWWFPVSASMGVAVGSAHFYGAEWDDPEFGEDRRFASAFEVFVVDRASKPPDPTPAGETVQLDEPATPIALIVAGDSIELIYETGCEIRRILSIAP